MTKEQICDLRLLELANDKGKFAIEVGYQWTTIVIKPGDPITTSQDMQDAFERGIDNEWFTLVDLSPIQTHDPMYPNRICRVFKLAINGSRRKEYLRNDRGIERMKS